VDGRRSNDAIVQDALALHALWKAGRLGGEVMPEDVHPPLGRSSDQLAIYFMLGMALNYQRNSYALWRACTAMFDDTATQWVFDPERVADSDPVALAGALLRHRVALQPNRHPQIWRRNAEGLVRHAGASVESLFRSQGYDVGAVRDFIQVRKADFPYLAQTAAQGQEGHRASGHRERRSLRPLSDGAAEPMGGQVGPAAV
jgi:hypothetical protein